MDFKKGNIYLPMVLLILFVFTLIPYIKGTPVSTEGKLIREIEVSATGEAKLVPDTAYLSVNVFTEGSNVNKAQEQNTKLMQEIYDTLKKHGIKKEKIKTNAYNVSEKRDWTRGDNPITGYRVDNSLEITIQDLEKVGTIIDSISKNNVTIGNLRFDIEDKSSGEEKAVADALEVAKKKGQNIAKEMGVKLGKTISVRVDTQAQDFPIYYGRATKESLEDSATPISPGENTYTARVQVIFEIE